MSKGSPLVVGFVELVPNEVVDQELKADSALHIAMQSVNVALNELIHNCKSIKINKKLKQPLFHQSVDLILVNWDSYFPQPKSAKYRKVYERALSIQPQLGHLDKDSFNFYCYERDLECLVRIATSIKRPDVEKKIRSMLLPSNLIPEDENKNNETSTTNGHKNKDKWVRLKDEGKVLFEQKKWLEAMKCFSHAIHLNSEEGLLYYSRAQCEINLAEFSLAKEDAEDALLLEPKSAMYSRIHSEAMLGLDPTKATLASTFFLGKNYLLGENGVVQDLKEAERYLKIAADIGHPEAEFLLGKLYLNERKSKEGLTLIENAANKEFAEAQYEMGRILVYGLNGCVRHELKAKKWFLKAQGQGFHPSEFASEKWNVEEMLRNVRGLLAFESKKHLTHQGMSIRQRHERLVAYSLFNLGGVEDWLERSITFSFRLPQKHDMHSVMNPVMELWLRQMMKRAKLGSMKAQAFFNAHRLIVQAERVLKNQTHEAFVMLRQASQLWDCPVISVSVFVEAAQKALKDDDRDCEAMHVLVSWDVSKQAKEKLFLAQRCVELQPCNPRFHHSLGGIYGSIGKYKKALGSIDRALQLDAPSDCLLYDRASLIRLMNHGKADGNQVVEAYESFLASTPDDGRYVPEAYYWIAQTYLTARNLKKANLYWIKGQKVESKHVRLPCFQPIAEDFSPKENLQRYFNPISSHSRESSSPFNRCEIIELFCSTCLRSNPALHCNFCRKWVCGPREDYEEEGDRDCQKAHIQSHKTAFINQ